MLYILCDAFGESLSFAAQKKVTPEFRCARRGRQKGHLAAIALPPWRDKEAIAQQ
jgi:hypothetical protein